MELIVKNHVIDTPLSEIIRALRAETGDYYFNFIGRDNQEHLMVTCAFHKDGQERHPSASFYNSDDNPDVEYGFFKCFTCGKKLPLYKVVNHCFGRDENDEFGKEWLVDRFGKLAGSKRELKPLYNTKEKNKIILDPAVLMDYNYIHPYMYRRKLTDDVISQFKIGYDKDTDSITFPCWDVHNNLIAINRRSVSGKRFEIASNTEKEVYLLNFIRNRNIQFGVYVCESQINCLNCWSYGFPAVALLGTGAKNQYQLLQKSGIRTYVLCLDPDAAGRSGVIRFVKAMRKSNLDTMISVKDLPDGKDVNDLTEEEFLNAPVLSVDEWATKHNIIIS